jgi:hypothetical protein
MPSYELKLDGGKSVVWEGKDPEDAALRYVDTFRAAVVVACRHYPRHGVFVWGGAEIIEPGHWKWGKE